MKNILYILILSFSMSSLAIACYDAKVTDKVNFDNCEAQAQQGAPEAQLFLGGMYLSGRGATKNYKEAFKWIKKSAQQGVPEAQLVLWSMYSIGRGVTQNHKEASSGLKNQHSKEFLRRNYL